MKPINEARMRAFEAILPAIKGDITDDERTRRAISLAVLAARELLTLEDQGGADKGANLDD